MWPPYGLSYYKRGNRAMYGKVAPYTGPLFKGSRMENCGCEMVLENVKDHKDGITWRCRKTHNISMVNGNYKIKDVKVSICHNT